MLVSKPSCAALRPSSPVIAGEITAFTVRNR